MSPGNVARTGYPNYGDPLIHPSGKYSGLAIEPGVWDEDIGFRAHYLIIDVLTI
jgi:hypothetical protein